MKNVTERLGQYFVPLTALLVYRSRNPEADTYMETYDIDEHGCPTNGRPLTLKECADLGEQLSQVEGVSNGFLKLQGLMPENLLYLDPARSGFAVWYTQEMEHTLHFTESLGIPSGTCCIPPMIWKASRDKLWVYAWSGTDKPTIETNLFKAPFFNIYSDNSVCMGTVKRNSQADKGLEDFMHKWMKYFFNSYFSHALGASPVKTNIVNLWKDLSGTGKPFPMNVLNKANLQLKNIIG